MNESNQFVRFLKEARDSQNFFTLNRLREAAKKKRDRELLEETWTNISLITEAMNGALCKVKPEKEEEERAIVVDEKMKESIERVFKGEFKKGGPSTYLVTLSGTVNKGAKALSAAVRNIAAKHRRLNPGCFLFYSEMEAEDLFKHFMDMMQVQDLFLVNLDTGWTVSGLDDYAFLFEGKGVRVVKDSDEDDPGEEEE